MSDPVAPSRDETAVDPAEVAQVQGIMHALAKCARSFKLYAKNNEMLIKFLNDLFEALASFIEEKDQLNLTLRPFEILFGGEVVYENDDRTDSLAFKLYKDGVRQVTLFQGLDKKELSDFLDIVATDFDRMDMIENDIVTEMWNHDFEKISYVVVETFTDDISDDEKQELDVNIDSLVNLIKSDQPPDQAIKAARLSTDDILAFKRQKQEEEYEIPQIEDAAVAHIFQVTEREFNRLQAEIESIGDGARIDEVVNLVFDILEAETRQEDAHLMLDVLMGIVDSYLVSGEIKKINEILKRLRFLEKPEYAPNFRFRGAIGTLFTHVAKSDRVEQLLVHLNNQTLSGSAGDLFSFLNMQDAAIVPVVLDHLGEIQAVKQRRLIVDGMILLAKGNIEPFANRLTDNRWFVVTDMLYALGKIGAEPARPLILSAFGNEHPRVRQEVIASLRKYHDEHIRELMFEALADADGQVRSLALRHLANARDAAAVKPLVEKMREKEFVDRPIEEKKRYFTALAMIGGGQLVPFFRNQLAARGVLSKGHLDEMRAGAAAALGIVGTSEAIQVLESGAQSTNKAIQNACSVVLERLGRSPGEGGNGAAPLEIEEDGGGGAGPAAGEEAAN